MFTKLIMRMILFVLMIVLSVGSNAVSGKTGQGDLQKGLVPVVPQKTPMIGGAGDLLQFAAGGHVLGFRKGEMFVASGDHAVKVEFIGARAISPEEEGALNDPMTNRPAARPMGKVTYRGLWDGVNLVYEKHGSGVVKSTYNVGPSGVVESIRLRYNVPVKVAENGGLALTFNTGEMRESRPVAWQEIGGKIVDVKVSYCLTENNEVGFKAGSYDSLYPLVIDPVLTWHTFLGSASADNGYAIAVDSYGNICVAGLSNATWGTPVISFAGGDDAFVAKLNSNGVLLWNAFLGSASSDCGYAVAVDSYGNVYVAGLSYATWGAPINSFAGKTDAFVAKLNSMGGFEWNTFMGSASYDCGNAVAVDSDKNVYVAGKSFATWGTNPVNSHAGGYDAFVAKLDLNGYRMWNTFMGSASTDDGTAITLDSTSGDIYVAGSSYATWGSPINPFAGATDAFVAKLNSDGIRQWNTFMGSSSYDFGCGVAMNSEEGYVYIAGYSGATWGMPFNPFTGSNNDAFAAKLDSSGILLWNTFMGSRNHDYGRASAVLVTDSITNIYIAGQSCAGWGAPVNPYAGGYDAFVVKIID